MLYSQLDNTLHQNALRLLLIILLSFPIHASNAKDSITGNGTIVTPTSTDAHTTRKEGLVKYANDTIKRQEHMMKTGTTAIEFSATDFPPIGEEPLQDAVNIKQNISKASSEAATDATLVLSAEIDTGVTKNELLLEEKEHNSSKPLKQIIVRKCCQELEFFSVVTGNCETATAATYFTGKVMPLIQSQRVDNVDYSPSSVKNCSENNGVPLLSSISIESHIILENGTLYDIFSQELYNHSEYCLELIGETPLESEMTLVFCPKSVDYSYYYDNDSVEKDLDMPDEYEATYDDTELIVRKCCPDAQYYNSDIKKCIPFESAAVFLESVQALSFENGNNKIKILASFLDKCHSDFDELLTAKMDLKSYRLRNNGFLIHTESGKTYDSRQYCLEKFGNASMTDFTLIFCERNTHIIPKCCPSSFYFNIELLECLPINQNNETRNLDLHEKFEIEEQFEVKPLSQLLQCESTFPSEEHSDNIHFNKGKLCSKGTCYDAEEYCIEFASRIQMKWEPIAFFCRTDFYVKCCPNNEILDNNGCRGKTNTSSFLLKQLSRTRKAVNAFDYRNCEEKKALLLGEGLTSYVQWWLSQDGSHLTVETDIETRRVNQYCIDDFINLKGKIEPSAFVCEESVKNMMPRDKEPIKARNERQSIGKCCPRDTVEGMINYFSLEVSQCMQLNNGTIKNSSFLYEAGLTKEHFRDFPGCSQDSAGYHSYPILTKNIDHAALTDDGTLKIISMDGKCISSEELIENSDYCYEYQLINGQLEPFAFVCAHEAVVKVYEEKFGLVSSLLGISCVFLLSAFVFLLTMKVRRGVVTTRKVNTLAGKILISFVGSHLLGYISLTLTQHENSLNKNGTIWCYLLAGFIQFFNLATFCWNTSICLESLLLTIHIRISERLRYLLHSLWAWGFPALMTTLMLLMDKYKDDLPCGTITPNIGVRRCFYSGNEALLVYFYVPIAFTLISNALFLFGGKALRRSRLRKLEMAPTSGNKKAKGKSKASDDDKPTNTPAASGMRTHQTQNTKAESVRIVLWTGGTWFLELAGFIMTRYVLPHHKEVWYDYLWYIPTSINALRGVGIFFIVVMTPEIKAKLKRHTDLASRAVTSRINVWPLKKTNSSEGSTINDQVTYSKRGNRNMSIATVISNLSTSFRNSSIIMNRRTVARVPTESNSEIFNNNPAINDLPPQINPRFAMARSVSQIERRSSLSSMASGEDFELDSELQRRRSSVATINSSLSKLSEEESAHEKNDDPQSAKTSDNEPINV